MTSLFALVGQYRQLETLDESEDLPAEVLRDTLEALTGDIEVKATNVARYVLNVEATAQAVENAAKAMAARAKRIRNRADSVREYLRSSMEASGITKIESPEFVLALKKNPPAVVIDNEAQIPEAFKVMPEPAPPPVARPDKKAIADTLKAHAVVLSALKEDDVVPAWPVPGAHMEASRRLDIRL